MHEKRHPRLTPVGLSTAQPMVNAWGSGEQAQIPYSLSPAKSQGVSIKGLLMSELQLKHVLVVDDEQAYRLLVQQYLLRSGYTCEMASDASDALAKLRTQKFDLVISDLRMKGVDGFELMKEALGSYPDLNFIMMTGYAADYSYSDIIGAGASDYLAKPFEISELKAKLQRIDRERRMVKLLESANAALSYEASVNASLAELSKALMASAPVGQISLLVLEHAKKFTGSQYGFVGHIDPRTGYLVCTTISTDIAENCQMTDKDFVFKEFTGLWGWVLNNRKALLTNNPRADQRSAGIPRGHVPVERFLSVPAVLGEQLIGQIALANPVRDYTERDLAVLERLAELYSLAVERKRFEERLEQTVDYVENVLANSADAIGIINEQGRAVRWNKMATELYGYSLEELADRKIFDLYADKDELGKMLAELRREGFVKRYEIYMKKKDGTIAPFEISISLLKDDHDRVLGSVSVARDLSELKKMVTEQKSLNEQLQQEIVERKIVEEELRQARHELQQLLEERTAKLSKAGDLLKRSMKSLQMLRDETPK
jgi:PAS domain S-box-containing protein